MELVILILPFYNDEGKAIDLVIKERHTRTSTYDAFNGHRLSKRFAVRYACLAYSISVNWCCEVIYPFLFPTHGELVTATFIEGGWSLRFHTFVQIG